jgi:hypothetical protein
MTLKAALIGFYVVYSLFHHSASTDQLTAAEIQALAGILTAQQVSLKAQQERLDARSATLDSWHLKTDALPTATPNGLLVNAPPGSHIVLSIDVPANPAK